MILALDTSTFTASAAVVTATGEVVAALASDPASPSDRVLTLCATVLAQAGLVAADLDAIAAPRSPGASTRSGPTATSPPSARRKLPA